jgi:hypothetical protein
MAINTRTQSASRTNTRYSPALAPDALTTNALNTPSRFSGNSSTRSHTTRIKIVWPEKFHQRFVLPSGIEYQPF